MITREYLEARIAEFIAVRDKLQADVAANNGAIQICRHLLATLATEAASEAAADKVVELVTGPTANGEDPVPSEPAA